MYIGSYTSYTPCVSNPKKKYRFIRPNLKKVSTTF